jgi:hypothetical protein
MTERFHTFIGFVDYGGPGSGNHGHSGGKGGPGNPGGSSPKDGGGSPKSSLQVRLDLIRTADKEGIPGLITAAEEELGKHLPEGANNIMIFDEDLRTNKESVKNAIIGFTAEVASIDERFPKFKNLSEWDDADDTFNLGGLRFGSPESFGFSNSCYEAISGHINMQICSKSRMDEYHTRDEVTLGKGSWLTGDTFASRVRHELGHAISSRYDVIKSWDKCVNGIAGTRVDTDLSWKSSGVGNWFTKNVSHYAGSSYEEAFSECFSAYTSSTYKEGRSKLPKPIDDYFKDLLGA